MVTSLLIGFTRRMQCAQVKFSFLFNTRQLGFDVSLRLRRLQSEEFVRALRFSDQRSPAAL